MSLKSLHVLGTVQTGAPTTPVVFSTSVSVYVMGGLLDVSVPLGGVGAVGTLGFDIWIDVFDTLVEDFDVCRLIVFREEDGPAAKLTTASEAAEMQSKTATKLRALTKPDLEEDFFFMTGFV